MATILLVDDSESIRTLLTTALVAAGHTVVEAPNGRKAQLLAASRKFELIVTDIYMPDGDGIELLAAVSKLEHRPPVIAMSSAMGPMNLLRSAQFLGAQMTLQKPFLPEELLSRVSALLSAPAKRPPTARS